MRGIPAQYTSTRGAARGQSSSAHVATVAILQPPSQSPPHPAAVFVKARTPSRIQKVTTPMIKRIGITVVAAWALLSASSGFAQVAQVRVEPNVVYGMVSGTALLMDVYRPSQPNGLGIVWVSGNGWATDPDYGTRGLKEGPNTQAWAKSLAEAGYTVFCANVRTTPVFRYPAPLEDVRRAIRFVRHNAAGYGVDPRRIGGLGFSSGAQLMAMAGMTVGTTAANGDPVEQESGALQALVLRAGPFDLTDGSSNAGNKGALLGMAPPAANAARTSAAWRTYAAASPLFHASPATPPTLLIHGDADQSVSIEQSRLLEKRLLELLVPTKLITIPGGTHGGVRFGLADNAQAPANWPDYLGEMAGWFDRHLRASSR